MRNSISNAQTHHDCRKTFIVLSLRHASEEKLYKVIWRTCWTNLISVTHQKKTMRRLVFRAQNNGRNVSGQDDRSTSF